MGKIYIGTSGWVYSHWEQIFYPKKLASKDKLKYFSQHFKTTEVNYSFYRLPSPLACKNWYSQTPGDFLFSLKASRFITHVCLAARLSARQGRRVRRFKDVKKAWKIFIKNAFNLKEKLGPILFQFPPSFKATEESIKRLEKFLSENCSLPAGREQFSVRLRLAFEFRHKSWCQDRVYKLLKKYNTAWVIVDSPKYPKAEVLTADFLYIRMHGSKFLFSSKYTKKELRSLAQKIRTWQKQKKDVFVYFNNDAFGYALENAKTLIRLI